MLRPWILISIVIYVIIDLIERIEDSHVEKLVFSSPKPPGIWRKKTGFQIGILRRFIPHIERFRKRNFLLIVQRHLSALYFGKNKSVVKQQKSITSSHQLIRRVAARFAVNASHNLPHPHCTLSLPSLPSPVALSRDIPPEPQSQSRAHSISSLKTPLDQDICETTTST